MSPLAQSELDALRTKGYVALSSDRLGHCTGLFAAAKEFFEQPEDSEDKCRYAATSGPTASEEGYLHVLGEKRLFTVKRASETAHSLRRPAAICWSAAGDLLLQIARQIASDMHFSSDCFDKMIVPCMTLHEQLATPSLLRLFRYDRPDHDSLAKLTAEPHRDLGLLTVVFGSSAGLEAWDPCNRQWDTLGGPSSTTVTVLVGQTLRYLTHGTYMAGTHRVLCKPVLSGTIDEQLHRYSIVFALRGYEAPLHLRQYTSDLTGDFSAADYDLLDGKPATVLLRRISSQHFNINADRATREAQRHHVVERVCGRIYEAPLGPPTSHASPLLSHNL
ncbi:hypothetical protein PYCC9005_002765 [Savitreella phatthalungensis]